MDAPPPDLHGREAGPSAPEHPAQPERAPDFDEQSWITPPFQPLRAIGALALTACGFGLYEYVLVSFWSVSWMGLHQRTPWPVYALLAAAMVLAIASVRMALGLWSPHAKLGFGLLAFFACIVVGVGGGRFVSYTLRGTLNPPFTLRLKPGERFPAYALLDQNGAIVSGPSSARAGATLIYIYRGDYCPFARFELGDLNGHAREFQSAGIALVGISTDSIDRSKMLAGFLRTSIPLLSDTRESILAPLGLVQHHRSAEPDNAIPAIVIVDRAGIARWIFTSPYYRELPETTTLLKAAKQVVNESSPHDRQALH